MTGKALPSVAVIGAGWMGETHLRCYRALGVPIVGVVDPRLDRASRLAESYGAAAAYASVEELLRAQSPDAVSVTTPENHHEVPAVMALERGIAVLLEKPLSDTLESAMAIVETARRSGAPLVPAHVLRFAGPYRAVHDSVRAGEIGQVVGITARRDRPRAVGARYAHVHPAALTMVHDIDQVLWLTGARPLRARALEHRPSTAEQADLVLAHLELSSGAIASLSTALLHPDGTLAGTSDRLEVYGDGGVATVDTSVSAALINGRAPDWVLEPADGGGAFGAEIAHFVDCVMRGRSSDIIPLSDALAGMRVIDAILRSVERGGAIIDIDDGGRDAGS